MKRIWKQAMMISALGGTIILWACLMTASIQDPRPSSQRKRLELSSHLTKLEHEIATQKKESSILLNKMRARMSEPGARRDLGLEQKLRGVAAGEETMEAKVRDIRLQLGEGEGVEVPRGAHPVADEKAVAVTAGKHSDEVIPVLVFVCNRPTVTRCLDKLLKYRPSESRFPIVVSQDCGRESPATQALLPYENKFTHLFQPDLSEISLPPLEKRFAGYYKIARHYGWALNQVFNTLNYSSVIMVEDDLEIASDFFDYFSAGLDLLRADPSLWCISAWNDNGKAKRINESASELLHRTDFFPGLGWMLRKEMWDELGPKWPKGFWDDWMREPAQRKDRACIRPEISRTSTFGKVGVSEGTYYLSHLQFIRLNDRAVPFTSLDLSYLIKGNYDSDFVRKVYSRRLVGSIKELGTLTEEGTTDGSEEFRLMYKTKAEFRKLARQLDIMEDFKAGVPRTAYRGVVTFMFNNHRVYLAPGANWAAYQLN